MKIFKEKAGMISEDPIWVCMTVGYLYTADTLRALLWLMITEWKHDNHVVGHI